MGFLGWRYGHFGRHKRCLNRVLDLRRRIGLELGDALKCGRCAAVAVPCRAKQENVRLYSSLDREGQF